MSKKQLRFEKLIQTIESVVKNFSESSNNQINLSAKTAVEILSHHIAKDLIEKGWVESPGIEKIEFHEANRYTEKDRQKVALVDIDETICFYSDKRRYDLSEPNYKNIAKINDLHKRGWKIIYWTARGSTSKKDYTQYTHNQLKEWGCKYHKLITGTTVNPKPHFDLLIDDKSKRIEEL